MWTTSLAQIERDRIRSEYRRREREIDRKLYAPWQPAEILMRSERKRWAAILLHRAGVFPVAGTPCLEIGYGTLGWLGELISWGLRETDLYGIELDFDRACHAQNILPLADLRIGDAAELPWENERFQLVISSTVFTSILDSRLRRLVAQEINRVLTPGGALLWYDFAVNNPKNPHVRKVSRRELRHLFPTLQMQIKSLTLAPPLARWISTRSWVLASLASTIPVLRTHLLAVLVKQPGGKDTTGRVPGQAHQR